MLPEFNAQRCYQELSAGQLPLDDHHIVDWVATHPEVMAYEDDDDLDDHLEEFCKAVQDEEAKAKTIAGAAE